MSDETDGDTRIPHPADATDVAEWKVNGDAVTRYYTGTTTTPTASTSAFTMRRITAAA